VTPKAYITKSLKTSFIPHVYFKHIHDHKDSNMKTNLSRNIISLDMKGDMN